MENMQYCFIEKILWVSWRLKKYFWKSTMNVSSSIFYILKIQKLSEMWNVMWNVRIKAFWYTIEIDHSPTTKNGDVKTEKYILWL